MSRQGPQLELIPEDEEVELRGGSHHTTPNELDLLITQALERPCCLSYLNTSMPNIVEAVSQPHGNPFEDNNSTYPSTHEHSPPSLPQPSPSSTASFYTAPSSPAPTLPQDHSCPQLQNLLAYIKERTQKRLQQTDLTDNFFTEWAIVTSNMYGGVTPPDSEYSVPPFALPSYDGQVRLRFISKALGLSLAGLTGDIEKFLSRNLFIITCLVFNIVPNPNMIFDDDDGFCCGVNVDRPGEWTDPEVIDAVNLSMSKDIGFLATLCKTKVSHTLPSVSRKMDEMVREDPQLADSPKLYKEAVKRMRENRPYSLLRNEVMPEDVVA
ncbi:hypothetical protein LI328DRAFT_160788 [Trichoderma asperelloides]|nr:hypothetical protein LI328DRAFT_160788 [Trichoderma asperelloides]